MFTININEMAQFIADGTDDITIEEAFAFAKAEYRYLNENGVVSKTWYVDNEGIREEVYEYINDEAYEALDWGDFKRFIMEKTEISPYRLDAFFYKEGLYQLAAWSPDDFD
jgi:hypothetical protein